MSKRNHTWQNSEKRNRTVGESQNKSGSSNELAGRKGGKGKGKGADGWEEAMGDEDEEDGAEDGDMSKPLTRRMEELGKEIQGILREQFGRLPLKVQSERTELQSATVQQKVVKTKQLLEGSRKKRDKAEEAMREVEQTYERQCRKVEELQEESQGLKGRLAG
jgi:hypothetical protein